MAIFMESFICQAFQIAQMPFLNHIFTTFLIWFASSYPVKSRSLAAWVSLIIQFPFYSKDFTQSK